MDIRQFIELLYDCVSNMKLFLNFDRLFKNSNVLKSRTGKNPITALYNETKKSVHLFNLKKIIKNAKISKKLHVYIDFPGTGSVEILKCFNHELQLEDIAFAIRSKIIDLSTGGFKFETTLVLEFKN